MLIDEILARMDAWVAERDRLCDEEGLDILDPRRRTPVGELKMPKFVRFHLLDSGEDCDEIYWEDPRTFTPRRGRNGYIDSWGLYKHESEYGYRDVDPMAESRRTVVYQVIYRNSKFGELALPELQFINALIEQKISKLKMLDLGDLPRRDYILYFSPPFVPHPQDKGKDRFWRRVQVSGGLPLGVFSDKIIIPLWGWVRNFHAHIFHDYKDGALFGPKDCNSVDMMHLDKSGRAYIPEEEYCIAHLMQKPGDVIGYHYDLGDNWWLDIKLEEIKPLAESTNAFEFLGGAGCALPDGEDFGNFELARILEDAAKSRTARHQAMMRIFGAMNYADKFLPLLLADFDFDRCDAEETRAAVRAALDSKASLPWASKKFVAPIGDHTIEDLMEDESVASRLGRDPRSLKKGTRLERTPVEEDGVFLEEGILKTRSDNPRLTACAFGGSPHDLKACSRCRQRFYCSKTCQTAHWKNSHRSMCK